jgi:hypothetical protein
VAGKGDGRGQNANRVLGRAGMASVWLDGGTGPDKEPHDQDVRLVRWTAKTSHIRAENAMEC